MKFSDRFLERYEIGKKLGQGGMGEVVLATVKATGAQVAVKTILAGHFEQSEGRARFLEEARITQALSHPAIIRVVDQGQEEEFLYLVLEFVSGGDLAQLLHQYDKLTPELFFRVAIPLLEGVAHAHASGVLHRDLKPANIFLDADRRPRIADFGLAKDQTNLGLRTATGVIMGTPTYMAPELALGQRAAKESDQYGLGIILYEMLAGKPPFVHENIMVQLRLHLDEPATPLERLRNDVPAALSAAIHRSLAKAPAERWPSVDAFAAAVKGVKESAGLAWKQRAEPQPTMAPRGPETVTAPASAVGSRQRVPPPAAGPAATMAPTSPEAIVGRSGSGITRRTTGGVRAATAPGVRSRPSIRIAVPPPPPRTWLWPAIAVALGGALVMALVLKSGRAVLPAESATPAPAVSNRPAVSKPKLVVQRRRTSARISWTLESKAHSVRATLPTTIVEAKGVTSLTLTDLPEDRTPITLQLTPGDAPDQVPFEWRLVLVEVEDARTIERLLSLAGPVLDRPGFFKRFFSAVGNTLDERCVKPVDARVQELAREHGIQGVLDDLVEKNVVEALEQAADVLDRHTDHDVKASAWRAATALAELETFCWLYKIYPTGQEGLHLEALRFLYACGPGALDAVNSVQERRPLLQGAGDYRRRSWKFSLLDPGLGERVNRLSARIQAARREKKAADRASVQGGTAMPPRWVEESPPPGEVLRALEFLTCVETMMPQHERDGLVSTSSAKSDVLPLEYIADQKGGKEAFRGAGSCVLRPVEIVPLIDPEDRGPFAEAELIIEVSGSTMSHARLTLVDAAKDPPIDFFFPPGIGTRERLTPNQRLSCRVPINMIMKRDTSFIPQLSVHTFPGQGAFKAAVWKDGNPSELQKSEGLKYFELTIHRIFLRLIRSNPNR